MRGAIWDVPPCHIDLSLCVWGVGSSYRRRVRNIKSGHWHRRAWLFQARTPHEGASLLDAITAPHSPQMRNTGQALIPVVMSGIIAVYGLVVSVLIAGGRKWLGVTRSVLSFNMSFFPVL